MRQNAFIGRLLEPLQRTPFHPQWSVYHDERKSLLKNGQQARGLMLDTCAIAQQVQKLLWAGWRYMSPDYYQTAAEWYRTRPQIGGDGQRLPVKAKSVDTVLRLDMLEHLPRPESCLAEIQRVLRPGGRLVLQLPFLYLLHDTPYDFHHWTIHGLRTRAECYEFEIERELVDGHPIQNAASLTNLTLSKTILTWGRAKKPLFLLPPLVLAVIPGINLRGWLLARLSERSCSCRTVTKWYG